MFFKLKSYIHFLLKSSNEHGIHSPFVFNYLTKCIYIKPKKSKNKTLDLLLKSTQYFDFENLSIHSSTRHVSIIKKQFQHLKLNVEKTDLLFCSSPKSSNTIAVSSDNSFHNDSMIIYDNIHGSAQEYEYWKNLVKSDKVTVSIDFFHCGVVFFRKEQPKQHFTIRI